MPFWRQILSSAALLVCWVVVLTSEALQTPHPQRSRVSLRSLLYASTAERSILNSTMPHDLSQATNERQEFVRTLESLLQHAPANDIRLVDADEYVVHDTVPINSLVFEVVADPQAYILAILSADDRVNLTTLQTAVCEDRNDDSVAVQLSSPDRVESLCGFPPGCVPPLGLSSPPLFTVVEASLQHEQGWLQGGGGAIGRSTLVTIQALLEQPDVRVASFREDYLQKTISSKILAESSELEEPKPFFAVAPPPQDVARLVYQQKKTDTNPIQPVAFSTVGRISGIRRMARALAFCDLAPVTGEHGPMDLPWRSGTDGNDMAVQLIAGKTLSERLGGEEAGAEVIKRLKVGRLVLVTGVTNVQNRESLKNWYKNNSFDLVVGSIQILDERGSDFWIPLQPNAAPTSMNSVLAPARRPPRSSQAAPGMSYLSINQLYGKPSEDTEPYVTLVDNLGAVVEFSDRLSSLLLALTTLPEAQPVELVGIDCEWRPSFLAESANIPQPVLLLQVCLHSLKKIYLFDLKTLLRPLLGASEEMNNVEAAVAATLGDLLLSTRLVKVGFQLVQDLRRLSASYPHITAFQLVNGILDASRLSKKVMQLAKMKNARILTASLSRLSETFLNHTLNKEQQCSDWSSRPLVYEQLEYAALDAAVTPVIVESLLQKVDAKFVSTPQVGRWKDDSSFTDHITSWRFLFLETPDDSAIRKLDAKRIVGNEYVVSQNWITGTSTPPKLPSVSSDGPYTDVKGVLRIPPKMLSIQSEPLNALLRASLGRSVGRSKDHCVKVLTRHLSLPEGSRVDFPHRSGCVEFHDCVALFVNMQSASRTSTYPNAWLEGGKVLTWFLRENDWKQGASSLARKLMWSEEKPSLIALFVRTAQGSFICCGTCRVELWAEGNSIENVASCEWELVGLKLHLLDWEELQKLEEFQALLGSQSGL